MANAHSTSKPSSNPAARAARRAGKATITKPTQQTVLAAVAPNALQTAPSSALAQAAAALAAAPAAPAAAPATVALRGGAAVAQVVLTGKQYRTAAPHNVQWWQAITRAAAAGPASVAALAVSPSNPQGVPLHFVGYCLRRGYLAAAPVATA